MRGLPPDSATFREDQAGWTQADEVAATHAELSAFWLQILAQVWGVKPGRLPAPPRMWQHPGRPDPRRDRKVTSDPADVRRFFAQHFKG